MKTHVILPFIFLIIYSCSHAQMKNDNSLLEPLEFSKKIKETNSSVIVDVRTPEEYLQGHLQNARNIDWNGSDFEKQISELDTVRTIFVYCLSGGRSANAAEKIRSMGFSKVYELKGGLLKWRKEGLLETTNLANKSVGINKQQYDSLLTSDKLVLIDFYASWCAPCKKMKTDLDELEAEMKNKMTIIRIDADENKALFKQLNLETLPTLFLYKDKKLVWSHTGYIGKKGIANLLK